MKTSTITTTFLFAVLAAAVPISQPINGVTGLHARHDGHNHGAAAATGGNKQTGGTSSRTQCVNGVCVKFVNGVKNKVFLKDNTVGQSIAQAEAAFDAGNPKNIPNAAQQQQGNQIAAGQQPSNAQKAGSNQAQASGGNKGGSNGGTSSRTQCVNGVCVKFVNGVKNKVFLKDNTVGQSIAQAEAAFDAGNPKNIPNAAQQQQGNQIAAGQQPSNAQKAGSNQAQASGGNKGGSTGGTSSRTQCVNGICVKFVNGQRNKVFLKDNTVGQSIGQAEAAFDAKNPKNIPSAAQLQQSKQIN